MMNKYTFAHFSVLLFGFQSAFAQTNNLASSPYSLYGLGVQNELSTGKTNALGRTGLALSSDTFINNLNPASFGNVPQNRFLYDFGFKAQNETLFEDDISEKRFNANFSSLALAFSVSKKSGLGVTLIPFTNVGYQVLGIETEIDGSNESFISNFNGSGGLNDFKINYGYAMTDNLRLGLSASFLFGKIEENERNIISPAVLSISEENYYNGFRFGTGIQYDAGKKLALGAVLNLPSSLNGKQTNTIILGETDPTTNENTLDNFKLPLELGFGARFTPIDPLTLTMDYKRNFWEATDQSDLTGTFVDQDFFGLGAEYVKDKTSYKYWNRVNYRLGFNIDNGNLSINETRINNLAMSLGVGLPMNNRSNSMINIGYSYGQKGQISNGLIKENYHLLSINLSLEGIWFQKRLID